MKLAQFQRDALLVARVRLDPTEPGFCGSDEVRAALSDPRVALYLSTWVFPLLAEIEKTPHRTTRQRLRGDAAHAARARQLAAQAGDVIGKSVEV